MWRTDFDDKEFQKVFEFFYESRDVRDKQIHPAVFPVSLAKKIIGLFTHEGELVVDPFLGNRDDARRRERPPEERRRLRYQQEIRRFQRRKAPTGPPA